MHEFQQIENSENRSVQKDDIAPNLNSLTVGDNEDYSQTFLKIAKQNTTSDAKYLVDESELSQWFQTDCKLDKKTADKASHVFVMAVDGTSGGKRDGVLSEAEFVAHLQKQEDEVVNDFLAIAGPDRKLTRAEGEARARKSYTTEAEVKKQSDIVFGYFDG